MKEFYGNRRGVSKNFGLHFGYRAMLIESFHHYGTVQLHLHRHENGRRWRAKPVEIVWEEIPHGGQLGPNPEPFLQLDIGEEHDKHGAHILQALEDVFTPEVKKERPFVEGELEATKRHLDDMRLIALGAAKVDR